MRRGPGDLYGMVPRRVFSPFLRDEKWGRPQAKLSRPVPVPARGGQSSKSLRIRRLPLRFATLVPSPPAGLFLCRQRKRRKKPLKGTYFEAVPLRIPPRRPRGLRPPLDSPLLDRGRGFTKDEGQGCPPQRKCPRPPSLRSRCAHRLWQSVSPSKLPSLVSRPMS